MFRPEDPAGAPGNCTKSQGSVQVAEPFLVLTRRPGQGASAQDVEVQVGYRLAAVLTAVDHEAVAGIGDPLVCRDAGRRQDQAANQVRVIRGQIVQAGQVAPGDDQDVGRGLGVDVGEGQEIRIAENFPAGYFSGGDITEKTGTHISPRDVADELTDYAFV